MNDTMHIGVMMHFTDHTVTPADVAVAAEERGFESMFVTEHTHIPVRDFIAWWGGQAMPEEYKRLHDPLIALATAAGVTTRIKLGTGILVLAQRETLATAKQLASLDQLSGGRLVCGVGYGWQADELADHGIAWADRKLALREHIQAVRTLWTDDEAAHDGQRVQFGRCWSYPKPIQRPGPPLLLGAVGHDRALRDVVEYCDGWMPIEGTEPIPQRWQRLKELATEAGRDPAEFDLSIYGSSGDQATLDGHRTSGAHRVVIGLDSSGGIDDIKRQLDIHRASIERHQ